MSGFSSNEPSTVLVRSGRAAVLALPPGEIPKLHENDINSTYYEGLSSSPAASVSWTSAEGSPLYGAKYAKIIGEDSLVVLDADNGDTGYYR